MPATWAEEPAKAAKGLPAVPDIVKSGKTWVELDGQVYGAKPNELGPLGGGAGYRHLVTAGRYRVTTLDGLLEALGKAKAGDVVFLPGDVEIDCTERIFTKELPFVVPEGVTLASDRGQRSSQGALLFSDAFQTAPLIRASGPNVRITGLRLRGPDPKPRLEHWSRSFAGPKPPGHAYYYQFPNSTGIQTEHPGLVVDNCELMGWSLAAVSVSKGDRHQVHHNSIHHNQRKGLGYGVALDKSTVLIEYNLFNYNRHSIAGTGRPGSGYEARHNLELGESLSHMFDMHGGRDRRDGTDIAGEWITIHHNTFLGTATPVHIRGVPTKGAEIEHNWFGDRKPGCIRPTGNTRIQKNAYGSSEPKVQ